MHSPDKLWIIVSDEVENDKLFESVYAFMNRPAIKCGTCWRGINTSRSLHTSWHRRTQSHGQR